MKKTLQYLLTALVAVTCSLPAYAEYHIAKKFFIGGVGGYDYVRFDPASRRLFIAHMNQIEVLDADSGKILGTIPIGPGAHGTAFAPEFNHGFASSGTTRSITMFDLQSLAVLKVIKYTGDNPDAIEYEPATKRVYVGNVGSSGDVTVIDAKTGDIVATVTVAPNGVLENICFDGRGRMLINEEEGSNVHVLELDSLKEVARWPLAPAKGPTKGAIDLQHRRLFVTCSNNLLAVVNVDSGKVVATVPIGSRPDGVVYDSGARKVFVSNRDGTLTVIAQESADKYSVVQTLVTDPGCRTIDLDPQTGRLYLPTAKFGEKPAPTAEVPKPRVPVIPGTMEVLVIEK